METLTAAPDTSTLEGVIVVVGLIIARQACEILAKQIPDSATGWRAGVRRLFKTLALYTSNKE